MLPFDRDLLVYQVVNGLNDWSRAEWCASIAKLLDELYDEAHALGYRAGFEAGDGEGFDDGFDEGYEAGYEEGYNVVLEEAGLEVGSND